MKLRGTLQRPPTVLRLSRVGVNYELPKLVNIVTNFYSRKILTFVNNRVRNIFANNQYVYSYMKFFNFNDNSMNLKTFSALPHGCMIARWLIWYYTLSVNFLVNFGIRSFCNMTENSLKSWKTFLSIQHTIQATLVPG